MNWLTIARLVYPKSDQVKSNIDEAVKSMEDAIKNPDVLYDLVAVIEKMTVTFQLSDEGLKRARELLSKIG